MSTFKAAALLICTFFPSRLRIAVWRLLGMEVGVGCRISAGSIVVADHIKLDHGATIEPLTFIFRPKSFEMGERARIAAFVRITGYGEAVIGPQSFVAMGCMIDCTMAFRTGSRVGLGPRGTFYTHGSWQLIYNLGNKYRNGPIVIGSDTYLGMCAIVYPNVTIGDRTVVSPGLAIHRDVAPGTWVAPLEEAHRAGPLERLQVDASKRQAQIEADLKHLAEKYPDGRLDDSQSDRWVLDLAGGKIILLRGESDAGLDDLPRKQTVVWRLMGGSDTPPVPTFRFGELRVLGGWTPFAERIATLLCEEIGAHFVFESREDA
jgi:acetyltransferase-like isoleucine patch superfamily enzyme